MLYALLFFDEPGSAALRDMWRQRHLDYIKAYDEQTLFAGPFTADDETADLGSLRLIDFPGRAEAQKHVENEPYVTAGIQRRWHIHRWEASVDNTWRDCPRTEGNIQVLFHGLDKPGAAALRRRVTPANLAYLEANADKVITRGPLLADAGDEQLGSLFLVDVGDMVAARRFMAEMPFVKAGLFDEPVFHRWRFGRVYDRFKSSV